MSRALTELKEEFTSRGVIELKFGARFLWTIALILLCGVICLGLGVLIVLHASDEGLLTNLWAGFLVLVGFALLMCAPILLWRERRRPPKIVVTSAYVEAGGVRIPWSNVVDVQERIFQGRFTLVRPELHLRADVPQAAYPDGSADGERLAREVNQNRSIQLVTDQLDVRPGTFIEFLRWVLAYRRP